MCLFCKIANKEIPAKVAYEDEELFAFHDINPQAPIHILLIPKRHITGISDATAEAAMLIGSLMLAARQVAETAGVPHSGYRLVINNGPNAGQSVFHLHVHILGGRMLGWPPG